MNVRLSVHAAQKIRGGKPEYALSPVDFLAGDKEQSQPAQQTYPPQEPPPPPRRRQQQQQGRQEQQ